LFKLNNTFQKAVVAPSTGTDSPSTVKVALLTLVNCTLKEVVPDGISTVLSLPAETVSFNNMALLPSLTLTLVPVLCALITTVCFLVFSSDKLNIVVCKLVSVSGELKSNFFSLELEADEEELDFFEDVTSDEDLATAEDETETLPPSLFVTFQYQRESEQTKSLQAQ